MSEAQKAATPAPPPPAPAPAGPPPLAAEFGAAPDGHCNVLVDGKHVHAKNGDNLIEAAKRVGVEIPYFCYHPRLSIAGQCRMCLVETSDMPGRLVAGCQVRVKENLRIITETPAIRENQRACMEFHLVNHPVDCPICDQSGECKLQDYYMQYDWKEARISTYKLNKPKRKVFGPLVVYDGERCILCTRCVRFMNEVAKEPQIAMVGRGDHSEIDTVPGHELNSKYSGNTVDICPVGALLNRDFRFTSRVWYLDSVRTVCDGCANGCNVAADTRADAVYRLLPKRNEEVNQVWLCDDGRTSYHRAMDERVEGARSGRADTGEWPSIDAATDDVGKILQGFRDVAGAAVALSATLSTEEMFAAATFAKEVLGKSSIYAIGRAGGQGDDFLIRDDKNPNANGLKLVASAVGLELKGYDALVKAIDGKTVTKALFVGGEVPSGEKSLEKLETLVVLGVTKNAVAAAATYLLPLSTHYEQDGTFVNYYGRLQPFHRTIASRFESMPAWAWVSRFAKAMGSSWSFSNAGEAFALLASKAAPLSGLALASLPDTGLVLPGFAPATYPARAPRPAAQPSA